MSDKKGHTFGIFTRSQAGVEFKNLQARLAEDSPGFTNENEPSGDLSPNKPRAKGRWEGYQNPILGDPGKGKIGRWQTIDLDALKNMIDQIIEQYLRDKQWYSEVRCREALWNMYRRLEWYVMEQIDPTDSRYQRVLQMMKDCIYNILDPQEFEETQIFEEVFNDPNNYDSRISMSSAWEWEDIWKTYRGGDNPEVDDGVWIVRKSAPGTHTVTMSGMTLNNPGKVFFQWGAQFGKNDLLEFKVNGAQVWKTSQTTVNNGSGKNEEYELTAGTYDFEWVYTVGADSIENPFCFLDVFRLYEDRPKYHAELEEGELDPTFTYTSGWVHNGDSAYVDMTGLVGATETMTKNLTYDFDGHLQFAFSARLTEGSYTSLLVDGVERWKYTETGRGDGSLRDVRIPIDKGDHTFEWVVYNAVDEEGYGGSRVRFEDINFIEITPQNPETYGTYAGVDVPHCPAPYYHNFSIDYYNHFDNNIIERPLFSMKDLPLLEDFPGFFRMVSSTEDQEWELIHEGSSNVMKLDLLKLIHGNSSKIMFYWRYKKRGKIRFKYKASADKGNGLMFFINSTQVSPEWSQDNEWKEIEFTVMPGQTYKFDWLVRKQSTKIWGMNAVYIKDIECVEELRSWEDPAPIDYDNPDIGGDAFSPLDQDWQQFSSRSIIETSFDGFIDEESKVRDLEMELCGECDGHISFNYWMGVIPPKIEWNDTTIYQEHFVTRSNNTAFSNYGTTVDSDMDSGWDLDFLDYAETRQDNQVIEYKIGITDSNSSVRYNGMVDVICPEVEFDHYNRILNVFSPMWDIDGSWDSSMEWIANSSGDNLFVNPFDQGTTTASTSFTVSRKAELPVRIHTELLQQWGESVVMYLDGTPVFFSNGHDDIDTVFELEPGTHTIELEASQTLVPDPVVYRTTTEMSYGGTVGKKYEFNFYEGAPYYSVQRNWDMQYGQSFATADKSGMSNLYEVTLLPGATYTFTEDYEIDHNKGALPTTDFSMSLPLTWEEAFNEKDIYDSAVTMSSSWKWEDILVRYGEVDETADDYVPHDGIWYVEDEPDVLHWMEVDLPENTNPGFFFFQYGGKFSEDEGVDVYLNDKFYKRYSNSTNKDGTSPRENNVTIPLPPGNHHIRFEYIDKTEIEVIESVTEPEPIEVPPKGSEKDLNGEKCYTSGSDNHNINYGSSSGTANTTSGGHLMKWGGSSQSMLYTQGTFKDYRDNSANHIARRIENPFYGSASLTETITIYPSKYYVPEKVADNIGSVSATKSKDGYVLMQVDSVKPPNYEYLRTGKFDAKKGDIIKLYFDYFQIARVYEDYHSYNSDTKEARTCLEVRLRSTGGYNKLIHKDSYNTKGTNTKPHSDLYSTNFQERVDNWDIKKTIAEDITAPNDGTYYIEFGLQDVTIDKDGFYHDSSRSKGTFYYTCIRTDGKDIVKVVPKATNTSGNTWDDTYVEAVMYDTETGNVIETKKLEHNNGVTDHTVTWNVPTGKKYKIEYRLYAGDGTLGTAWSGYGSAFTVSDGTFTESWQSWCEDKHGNKYLASDSPYADDGEEGYVIQPEPVVTYTTETKNADCWCWLDVFRLYETTTPACDENAYIIVGGDVPEQILTEESGTYTVEIVNDTPYEKTYSWGMMFEPGCEGSNAKISGGMQTTELIEYPEPSDGWALVTFDDITELEPVEYGGCYGSNIHYELIDDSTGAVIESETFYSGGGSIDYNGLEVGNYTIRFTTDQGGFVSSVTGKDYRTILRLEEFEVNETWDNTPSPFCSKLEFYVDDVLMETFEGEQSGERTYPVKEGCHTYKWVFTGCLSEDNYDAVQIDWLQLTNWVCDRVLVTPYCEKGGGDRCIEALIKCLLQIYKSRPKACKVGKRIWLFT